MLQAGVLTKANGLNMVMRMMRFLTSKPQLEWRNFWRRGSLLWRWAFENRTTAKVSAAVADMKPVVWVTPKFGIARGCNGDRSLLLSREARLLDVGSSFDPTVLQSPLYEEIKQRLFPSIKERAQGIRAAADSAIEGECFTVCLCKSQSALSGTGAEIRH